MQAAAALQILEVASEIRIMWTSTLLLEFWRSNYSELYGRTKRLSWSQGEQEISDEDIDPLSFRAAIFHWDSLSPHTTCAGLFASPKKYAFRRTIFFPKSRSRLLCLHGRLIMTSWQWMLMEDRWHQSRLRGFEPFSASLSVRQVARQLSPCRICISCYNDRCPRVLASWGAENVVVRSWRQGGPYA